MKARQKIWENAKMPSFVSYVFCFEKCFKIDVIVSLHKRIICYLLWSIYWLANGQSALFRKWVFYYLTLWFLTLFLQFMKVHFILILNTWITLYNVSNFISRRDCISKILTFFWNMILSKSAVVLKMKNRLFAKKQSYL